MIRDPIDRSRQTRREVLSAAGAAAGIGALGLSLTRPAAATPAAMQEAIRKIVGEAAVSPGKVKIDMPPIVENGNSVPCSVMVDSPMTEADHVKAIHVFTEKNPQPNVISVKLGPRAGKAEIQTRVRLADTQTVVAICEMSDGSFWSEKVNVIITLGACLEDPV